MFRLLLPAQEARHPAVFLLCLENKTYKHHTSNIRGIKFFKVNDDEFACVSFHGVSNHQQSKAVAIYSHSHIIILHSKISILSFFLKALRTERVQDDKLVV